MTSGIVAHGWSSRWRPPLATCQRTIPQVLLLFCRTHAWFLRPTVQQQRPTRFNVIVFCVIFGIITDHVSVSTHWCSAMVLTIGKYGVPAHWRSAADYPFAITCGILFVVLVLFNRRDVLRIFKFIRLQQKLEPRLQLLPPRMRRQEKFPAAAQNGRYWSHRLHCLF